MSKQIFNPFEQIFQPSSKDYVDLRNPNPLGKDYLVFDYDGAIYPTDEARMLTRIGLIDFRIGDVKSGLNELSLKTINEKNSNLHDETCKKCRYQLLCGVDNIDKISRYGSLDVPTETLIFAKIIFQHSNLWRTRLLQKRDDIKNMNFHLTGFYESTTLFSGFLMIDLTLRFSGLENIGDAFVTKVVNAYHENNTEDQSQLLVKFGRSITYKGQQSILTTTYCQKMERS